MRYYVVADPHGFYTPMRRALEEKGFFEDKKPHRLVILGDLTDRGKEAAEMQAFAEEMSAQRKLILIRGNHEDLMTEMLENYRQYRMDILHGWFCHHVTNGTFDTALQLTGFSKEDALRYAGDFVDAVRQTPYVRHLIPKSKNYWETENYVFVHGWIPKWEGDWRKANKKAWEAARWVNGMEAAEAHGLRVPGKTVVCGHWRASYGHTYWEHKRGEEDHTPYFGHGVIGMDATTVISGMVNCIVVEDRPAKKAAEEKEKTE